jgi:osmoprotectant transport system permease protein
MAGLTQVAPAVIEAARGMGMTRLQILWSVRFPLASPAIIGGVRIALVQNIGLAAVAALIGGGGFGTFIFTGMGQTAIDLVLLGAVPIVVLAFTAALVLDGLSEMLRGSTA